MASLFADVIKGTKDFFKKSFAYENKIEIKSTSDNGVLFTSEGGLNEKRAGFASIKAEYKKGAVQVDKLQAGTDGKLIGEFSLPDVAPQTKATFKFEDGSRTSSADISAKFGVETKQDFGVATGITLDVDAVKATADASVLLKHGGVLAGASASVDTHMNDKESKGLEVTAYDALLGFQSGASTYGFQTENKFAKGTAFFYNAGNPGFTVTGKTTFGLRGGSAKDVAVQIGGKYKWDSATTLYGAVDQAANVQVAYETALSSSTSLTLFGEVKGLDLSSDSHRLGTKLSLKA